MAEAAQAKAKEENKLVAAGFHRLGLVHVVQETEERGLLISLNSLNSHRPNSYC